jgi:hypothetical protein
MKKIALLSAMLLATFIGFSQEKIQFGIHAGVNIASMTDKSSGVSSTISSKAGINAGVDVSIPVSPEFVVQPELSYSQMGGKVSAAASGASADVSLNLNYLSLPVLFKYKVPNSGLGIYIGPQFGYLMSASGSASLNGQSGSISVKDQFKSSDVSGVFGAEYYFAQGFGISARYQLGFVNVSQAASSGETVNNHGFAFTIGYRF